MSKATYPLKLPASIKQAAARLAKEDGVSLNQWIAVAVAEKVGVVETAEQFLRRRAGAATGSGLLRYLENAPDAPPAPGDEFPAKSRSATKRRSTGKHSPSDDIVDQASSPARKRSSLRQRQQ